MTSFVTPGSLWEKTKAAISHSIKRGALQTIPTDYVFIEQSGVRFLVRVLKHLAQKDKIQKASTLSKEGSSGKPANPFLPYDPDLFVADLSDTHLCLLNKYNVTDNHILIVTRQFEKQDDLLRLADFEALWVCMRQIHGLAFFNGGKLAGASQAHKHLQLVTLPLAPEGNEIPIEPLLAGTPNKNAVVSEKPTFAHAIFRYETNLETHGEDAPEVMSAAYRSCLECADIQAQNCGPSRPYNLLVTRKWMFLVPRAEEECESISVNSLGFAGTFLARNGDQLELLRQLGPMTILEKVGISAG